MENETALAEAGSGAEEYLDECTYIGTDFLDVKIYLIGVFAASIAILSLFFNSFFTLVFVLNTSLRQSPLYYFGILAVLDIIMAINYLLLMAVPVYMDQFEYLWLYRLFLTYFRTMLTLSNCAIFASVMLILLATVERLLRTFRSENVRTTRKFLEDHRPFACLLCIFISVVYKLCTYFEIHYVEHENCTGWSRYEIQPTDLAMDQSYGFWWMFLTRNLVERIIPFILLVFMNFLVLQTLKKEHLRSLLVKHQVMTIPDKTNKDNLRDATRALVSIVTMYLMSQSLQIFINVWEVVDKKSLDEDYQDVYSYLNDAMSIMTLLSSALRFPVYCACNRPISDASSETLLYLVAMIQPRLKGEKKPDYLTTSVTNQATRLVPAASENNDGSSQSGSVKPNSWDSSFGEKQPLRAILEDLDESDQIQCVIYL